MSIYRETENTVIRRELCVRLLYLILTRMPHTVKTCNAHFEEMKRDATYVPDMDGLSSIYRKGN